ncbi:(p)ppGpp synthetase, RelA/SpoT family [Anaerolinea thermolimosa]|uniref:RelA/SpoT family protein n=1 Tax=Anaerolinea thermolimosa TaxID=229919 RepID=UPI0007863928|nr:bifunctional (p)ppGpp synthetase/guanosine-3',5'-bis(diphosphate) 3'-pyrophosphohydrolase [Anaerolinea thermolimosa]GAP06735.1 (p)ppGpp synthetase, RelA/SpoT family [Anaerolinea thermolimosa]
MGIDDLLKSLPEQYTAVDRELIQRAYQFAESAHEGQKRLSGEPYITHCLAVASILADLRVPPVIIAAGLLHDTVEDTKVTLEDIRSEFGDEIARLVDGVTKLSNLPRVSRGDQLYTEQKEGEPAEPEAADTDFADDTRRKQLAQETLRKTFLAMGEDIRVVLIKLADRLHNMRTLWYMPEHKRKRIAQETLDIFAPLANRLGIWQIKWELEDLSFRHVNPEKYKEIAELLSQRRADREKQVTEIINHLKTTLEQAGITAEISGRPKHIYSIYRKMQEKSRPFDMLMDLRGVRLIVPTTQDCYSALGVIHTHWRPIPHEFDDYIAAPKDNNYQSLHTAVIYDDGKPLEVQIRTPEMHQNAEYGIAAHWRYKEKSGRIGEEYEQRVNLLRRLMDWRQEVTDAAEFMDGMKTDVFQDRVYVFTPRGDIIDLPQGSTPIDFAYHVHTEIGHRCRGAKVNGRLVTLDYELKTGDQVEILTAKHGGPSRDWLNANLGLVKTQRARAKIRSWFKWQDREQNLTQGKNILDRELRRLGIEIDIEKLARAFDFRTPEELYVAIGCGDITIGKIVNKIIDLGKEKVSDPLLVPHPALDESKVQQATVTVLGLKGILTTFARCCKPVPGDEIIGYITRGRGVTIHRQDCPNILSLHERDRIIRVSWGSAPKTYPVPVEIKAYDRQGLMGDISTILAEENINILDVNLKVSHHLANLRLVLEVGDIAQLSRVLTRIENLPNVTEAHRVKPG